MKLKSEHVINIEGTPLPGTTFKAEEIYSLLVRRLGAFLPGWHTEDGCPGELMMGNKWVSGKFFIAIDFIPNTANSKETAGE